MPFQTRHTHSLRWAQAVRLRHRPVHSGEEQDLRDRRHARLRRAGGAALRSAVPADGHLVDRRGRLRPADRFVAVRRRQQAGNVPERHQMLAHLSGRAVRRNIERCDRLHQECAAHQAKVGCQAGSSNVACTNKTCTKLFCVCVCLCDLWCFFFAYILGND